MDIETILQEIEQSWSDDEGPAHEDISRLIAALKILLQDMHSMRSMARDHRVKSLHDASIADVNKILQGKDQ